MPAVYAMLGNAAVAVPLALLALGVGWVCRSPAVRHFLWVVVLLKLVTPPLFHIPLAVLPAAFVSGDKATELESEPRTERSGVSGTLMQPLTPLHSVRGSDSNSVTLSARHLFTWTDWALLVWIVGAAGWFLWQGRRIVRFRRRVARAEDAGPEVAFSALRIAKALGIGRPPAVKAASGIGSPMLWGWGRGTVILFPGELLARLAPEARDTLLAHELAHFLRRDHWVRLLEFVVTGLYWWHPVVWLARVGIETAEEECCDALVVCGLSASPRRYAEALLATIDYVAELRRPCLPPGACPANRDAQLLQRRLLRIIHAKRPSRLRGSIALRAAVAAVLFIQPVLRAAPNSSEPRTQRSGVSSRPLPPLTPLRCVRGSASNSKLRSQKSVEPPAWATAPSPSGAVTAMARNNEVVLRRPDGTTKTLGPGKPLALAFAPNEPQLATAGPGTCVRTWDHWGNLLAEASVPAAARGIAYTPDGSCLLVLDAAGGISVRDPHTLAPVSSWSVEGPANSIACSPNSQTVAVSFGSWLDEETGWVECWSIAERRKLACYSASAPVGATRFASDGGMMVIGGWNGLLAWRKLPSGELISARQLPKSVVAAAAFSPDAATLPLDPPPPEAEMLPAPMPLSSPQLLQEATPLSKR